MGEAPSSDVAPDTSAPSLPVPPYVLKPLLFPTLPQDDPLNSPDPDSPAGIAHSQNAAVRCTEGDADNLYVGTSDGIVHAYSVIVPQQGSSRNSRPRYRLRTSRLISSNSKPVERILLLANLQLAAVLCEGLLSFYTLPAWTPARGLPSTRAVSTVVLDDDEVLNHDGLDGFGMVSLCIVRRKNIVLAKVGQNEHRDPTWTVIKDIPLPGGAIIARRYGDALCIANTTEYSLVNLSDGLVMQLHLPISQTGESPSAQVRPSIVSISAARSSGGGSSFVSPSSNSPGGDRPKCEFLITAHSGSVTLGVFVTPSGEPMPKLLEWPSHPRSLVYVSDYIFSLLRNDTIEVHDVRNDVMEKVQTEHLPPGVEPRFLTAFPAAGGDAGGAQHTADGHAMNGGFADLDIIKLDLGMHSTSKLLHRQEKGDAAAASRTRVILCGRNSVHTLDQDSLLDWGMSLLQRGHLLTLEEGLRTVEADHRRWQRQRGQRRQTLQEDQAARLRASQYSLLLQALTLEHLRRARFWDAGETWSKSGGDPRLLMAFFHDLETSRLIEPSTNQRSSPEASAMERPKRDALVPVALRRHVERLYDERRGGLLDVHALIRDNLIMNYSPPLDIETDPTLQALAATLTERALDMLLTILRSWRTSSAAHLEGPKTTALWSGSTMDDKLRARMAATVDGTLLRLLAKRVSEGSNSHASELDDMLSGDLACPPEEVARILERHSYHSMLAKLYEKEQRWNEVLDLWTGIIDGRIEDHSPRERPSSSGDGSGKHDQPAVDDVANLLSAVDDPALASKFGTWLVRKDPKAGVRILTQRAATAPTTPGGAAPKMTKEKELAALEGHRATLAELTSINANAADDFVEKIVLAATKTQDAAMHNRLLRVLVERTEKHLSLPENRLRHQHITTDFVEGSFAESFFAHLALAAAAHPDDADRLKLAMLLQGSTVLDLDEALEAVSRSDLLVYERAIILGKLGRDREALKLLAVGLRDANSAEAYCSQDGAVLSPMLANSVAEEDAALQPYAALVSRTHSQRSQTAVKNARRDAEQVRLCKEELLKTLLAIYMENGTDKTFRTATAHLLNTQALHLDSLEIIGLVPDDWPLSTLETVLSQSLRRQRHRRTEAEVTRSIAVCREFDVAEEVWVRLRAMGGVLQDTDEGSGGGGESGANGASTRQEEDHATVVGEAEGTAYEKDGAGAHFDSDKEGGRGLAFDGGGLANDDADATTRSVW